MKVCSILIGLLGSFSPIAFASAQSTAIQGLPRATPQVESSRMHITCSTDSKHKYKYKDGTETLVEFNGKSSESIRTTWKVGDKEYRFSEYQIFAQDGVLISLGRVMAEVEITKANGFLTEKSSSTRVAQYVGSMEVIVDGKYSRIKKDSSTIETLYSIQGDRLIPVKDIVNGQEQPSNIAMIIETQDSATQKTLKMISIPGTSVEGNVTIEVLKEEVTCVHQVLKP